MSSKYYNANMKSLKDSSNTLIIDYCMDVLFTHMHISNNPELLNIAEEHIRSTATIDKTKLLEARFYQPDPFMISAVRESFDKEPDFFPFSRIATPKLYDNSSSRFISQNNKLLKSDYETPISLINNTDLTSRSPVIHNSKLPYSNKESLNTDNVKNDFFQENFEPSNPENDTLWMVSKSSVPNLNYTNENTPLDVNFHHLNSINRRFELHGNTQDRLAKRYYSIKQGTLTKQIKIDDAIDKLKLDNNDSQNGSIIYDKFETELKRGESRPLEFIITKTKDLKQNKQSTRYSSANKKKEIARSSSKKRPENKTANKPINVVIKSPNPNKSPTILTKTLVAEKAKTREIKKNAAKKISLRGFDNRYINQIRVTPTKVEKQHVTEAEIKRVLNKEAKRIKKEIKAIKSNLESYKASGGDNIFSVADSKRPVKSDKFDHIHSIIRNSLYNMKK